MVINLVGTLVLEQVPTRGNYKIKKLKLTPVAHHASDDIEVTIVTTTTIVTSISSESTLIQ